jgi:hypothetical protein
MGAVQCERHGTHPGRLCCDHVREAVSNSTQRISFDKYQVDLIGDGSMPLEHLLCVDCARAFGLSDSDVISAEVWEDASRFPYVCPVCTTCIREWSDARRGPLNL